MTAVFALFGLGLCSAFLQRNSLPQHRENPDFRTIASNQTLLATSIGDRCVALSEALPRPERDKVRLELTQYLKVFETKFNWLSAQEADREPTSRYLDAAILQEAKDFAKLVDKFRAEPAPKRESPHLQAILARIPNLSHSFQIAAWRLSSIDGVQVTESKELDQIIATLSLLCALSGLGALLLPLTARVVGLRMHELQLEERAAELKQASEDEIEQHALERESHESTQSHLDVMIQACELSAKRYELLFQNMPVAMLGFDATGAIFESNAQTAEAAGIPEYGLLHRYLEEFVAPKDAILVRRMLRSVFRGVSYRRIGWIYKRPDGGKKYFLFSAIPMPGADGSISGAIATLEDATERYLARKSVLSAVNASRIGRKAA